MSNQNGKGDSLRKGANLSAYWENYNKIFGRKEILEPMTETCYSHNEEEFHDDMEWPLELAVESFLEDQEENFEGEAEIQIFEGEKIPRKISQFVPPLTEYIEDSAYGEGDEASEYWCEKIKQRKAEIQELVKSALDKWADENNMQPNFYGVKNVKSLMVKIKVDSDGNWEEVGS